MIYGKTVLLCVGDTMKNKYETTDSKMIEGFKQEIFHLILNNYILFGSTTESNCFLVNRF